MTKKISPSHSISHEPYTIWLLFMVYLCKMIISPGILFIFSKFWFFGLLGGKRVKNGPKWQKNLSVVLDISGTIHHMSVIYGTHVQNDNISRYCFHFFKILTFWVHRGLKEQKMSRMTKDYVCFSPYLRNHTSYDCHLL